MEQPGPDRWERIEALYHDAAARDEGDRAAFLAAACAGDDELRRDVESLLAHSHSDTDFFGTAVPRRIGSYELSALLGIGGMGEVYRARDVRLGRDVALKVLPQEFTTDGERIARFEREARALASLNHPNIAIIHGVEYAGTVRAIVMELVEGETLAEHMARGRLTSADATSIAIQIGQGLEAAHDKGIVHRDLKPANIKITPTGVAKVLDFGLAKTLDAATEDVAVTATQAGRVIGTAAYMSPEQAKGEIVDRRTDIWAFGVVLYEMLEGTRPFHGASTPELLAAIVREDPSLEAIPIHLRSIVARCLAKDPRNRWQSIADVRLLLEDRATAAQGPQHSARISRMPWVVAGGLLVALLSGAALYPTASVAVPQLVRFNVAIPGGDGPGSNLALSPDGTLLAISAVQDGRRNLYLRRIDSLTARLLPETEGATYPFWSPASDQVAFLADRKLKKVVIDSGQVVTLAEDVGAVSAHGGSWSDQGTILVASGGSLLTVAEAGGTAVTLPETRGAALPHFLPGGQTYLFTRTDATPSHPNQGVHVGFLNGSAAVRLLDDRVRTEYVPPQAGRGSGHLVFRREGRIMAQAFDVERLTLSGSAFPVASEAVISLLGYGPTALFSTSKTGVLAYEAGAQEQLVWVDRTGAVQEPLGPPGEYRNFRLSPDRTRIAMDVTIFGAGASAADVATLDLRRGVYEQVTNHGEADLVPVWSADGTRLVFTSLRLGSFQPFVTDRRGEEKHLAEMPPTGGWPSDWSPDGEFVLWSGRGLWAVPAASRGKPFQFVSADGMPGFARFSPDGRWVAYSSQDSGRQEVSVRRFPTGPRFRVSVTGGQAPVWRQDGREIFYIAADGNLTAVPVTLDENSIEFGRAEPLFVVQPRPFTAHYEVSEDGRRFLLSRPVDPAGASITVVLNWQAPIAR
jgi:Tol biopolymer transport system component